MMRTNQNPPKIKKNLKIQNTLLRAENAKKSKLIHCRVTGLSLGEKVDCFYPGHLGREAKGQDPPRLREGRPAAKFRLGVGWWDR